MTKQPEFDLQAAHRYFSATCFNMAWGLMDKSERTAEEDEMMIRLSLASHWHWTQREDYAKTNESIAYWQTSRIYAMLGQGETARHYGQLCLAASRGEDIPPFALGFAYEALARAEMVAGDRDKMEAYLNKARQAAEAIQEAESKKMLEKDLDTIQ
ncbi:MAG TPA: hypothetical protein G4O08_01345 [Anaerolineae bacterium]|nr:hypothetical protein [Anaerolineae bacterium]